MHVVHGRKKLTGTQQTDRQFSLNTFPSGSTTGASREPPSARPRQCPQSCGSSDIKHAKLQARREHTPPQCSHRDTALAKLSTPSGSANKQAKQSDEQVQTWDFSLNILPNQSGCLQIL